MRLVAFLATLLLAAAAPAEEYAGRTPPRLSLLEGEVSVWSGGSDEWEAAEVNLPLAPGDFLYTGAGSRIEIQIGARAFVRADGDTQLGLLSQDGVAYRFDVGAGRATLDLRDLAAGARLEVETPHGRLGVAQPGLYDIVVGQSRSAFTARQGGRGTVQAGGDSLELRAGTQIVAPAAGVRLARYEAPPLDDWDRWNSQRTDRVLAAISRSWVSEDVYGVSDLDDHGTWREVPEYGRVWVPARVAPDWAPYTTGRWYWDVDYGWSWIDAAPWGWAPYHYGRWVWVNNYWGWAPGPIVARPIYYPALVAFYGGPSVSVGVSVGFPYVSWVALGWGEPVIPWWGPTWYRGWPCWYGWGGPTIINNVYVDNRGRGHGRGHGRGRIHADEIKGHANQRVRNAMVAVRRDEFGRRSPQRMRLDEGERGVLRPVRSGNPVDPREAGVRPGRERNRSTRPERPQIARGESASDARRASLAAQREARLRPDGGAAALRRGERPERPEGGGGGAESGSERAAVRGQRPPRPDSMRTGDERAGARPPRPDRPNEVGRARPERDPRPPRPQRAPGTSDDLANPRAADAARRRGEPGLLSRSRPERPVPSRPDGLGTAPAQPARPDARPRSEALASRPRPERPNLPHESARRPPRPSSPPAEAMRRPRPDLPSRSAPAREPGGVQVPRAEAPPRVEQPQLGAPRIERPFGERPQPAVRPQRGDSGGGQYSAPQYRGFESPSRPQPRAEMPRQPSFGGGAQPRFEAPRAQPAMPAPQMRPRADFGSRAPDRSSQPRPQRQ